LNLNDVTPLILTYNEAANIERTLEALTWAQKIIVLDSGSTDDTVTLVARFNNAELISRPFDNHTAQWNYGLAQITTPWVLSLDADYVCPVTLPGELSEIGPERAAYDAAFQYCIHGKALRTSLYPPRTVLFRPDRFRYISDGHTQRLDVAEVPGRLKSIIRHDDRKPLSKWLDAQTRYTELEVAKLRTTHSSSLGWADRLRTLPFVMPVVVAFYCLLVKGLILNGRAGIYYTLQRVYAEQLLSLKLIDDNLSTSRSAQLSDARQPIADVIHADHSERNAVVPH
jgi:glycosyltransferase involved in cell wall biosynthesis